MVEPRWYVLHTKPKQESRAEWNLNAWGVEVLAPKVLEPRRWHSGDLSSTVAHLFPGYLFARLNAEEQLPKVRFTRGVHSVVGFGEYATPVDDAVIDAIRVRIHKDGLVRLDGPQRGDRVEVLAGPFRSFEGVFERNILGSDRVMILLTMLGASTRVQLDRSFVRRAAPASC